MGTLLQAVIRQVDALAKDALEITFPPQPGLSQADREALARWIVEGAK